MNAHLTAQTEAQAVALTANMRVKAAWQSLSEQFGKARADKVIAERTGSTVREVKAARYYW